MTKQSASSSKNGGSANLKPFPPGQSGNPGGRPKGIRSLIRSKVGQNAEKLVDYWLLVALSSDTEVKKKLGVTAAPRWQDRMAAVAELVDRGFGKAVQELDLHQHMNDLTPEEEVRINSLTDAELGEFNDANDVIHRLLYEEVP